MSSVNIIELPKFQDYEIIVSQNGEEFFLKIDELSIIARAKDLENALEKLKQNFSDSLLIYKESGHVENFPKPKKIVGRNKIIEDLKVFLIKFLIIGLIIFVISIFSATFITIKVKQLSFTDIIKSEVRKIHSNITQILPKDEEIKKKQIENFREFLQEIKPYLDELNSIQ